MERLEKIEDVIYTQNIEELPIEERVFFTQGLVANKELFRPAIREEIDAWEEYKKLQEEMLNNEYQDGEEN